MVKRLLVFLFIIISGLLSIGCASQKEIVVEKCSKNTTKIVKEKSEVLMPTTEITKDPDTDFPITYKTYKMPCSRTILKEKFRMF